MILLCGAYFVVCLLLLAVYLCCFDLCCYSFAAIFAGLMPSWYRFVAFWCLRFGVVLIVSFVAVFDSGGFVFSFEFVT